MDSTTHALPATPKQIAYARMSIAACFASQNRVREMVPELEAVAKMPNAPPEMRTQAQQGLSQVQEYLKRNPGRRPR